MGNLELAWQKKSSNCCSHIIGFSDVLYSKEVHSNFPLKVRFMHTSIIILSYDILCSSPRITGLSSDDTVFGYHVPFSLYTCKPLHTSLALHDHYIRITNPLDATIMILGSQVTYILRFFLSRNIRIARDRAWDQTVASRGKGPDFWQPYVEEWETPPNLNIETKQDKLVKKWLGGWFGLFVVKRSKSCVYQISDMSTPHLSSFSSSLAFPSLSVCWNGCIRLVQSPWDFPFPTPACEFMNSSSP